MRTDADIIRASLQRPPEFAALFDRHAPLVGRYARRRVGADAADDVLSETFLVAFRRRADYDLAYVSAVPWLLGIATRLIRRARADEARQWRAIEASLGSADVPDEQTMEAAAERMDAAARLRRLAPRIRSLPARDRDTLLLFAWGDLSAVEVAAALGVPIGTVWSRLNRVRRRFAVRPLDTAAECAEAEGEGDGRPRERA